MAIFGVATAENLCTRNRKVAGRCSSVCSSEHGLRARVTNHLGASTPKTRLSSPVSLHTDLLAWWVLSMKVSVTWPDDAVWCYAAVFDVSLSERHRSSLTANHTPSQFCCRNM